MTPTFSQFTNAMIWIYNALLVCIPSFLIIGVAQLAMAIAFWRSENRKKWLKRGVALLLVAILLPLAEFVLWRGVIQPSMAEEMKQRIATAQTEKQSATSYLGVGDEVPELDDRFARSGTPLGSKKLLVLNFFATWCGPCLAELPHFQRLADKYEDRTDISFIVVGREESKEAIDAFVSQNGYRMQFVADPERILFSQFSKELIPRTYLIDANRKICFEIVGYDEEKLKGLDAKLQELTK